MDSKWAYWGCLHHIEIGLNGKRSVFQWLNRVFIPAIKVIGGKHFLILDGHNSHTTLQTIEKCKENNIRLVCLPACLHATHILQPLDVEIFNHVKRVWKKALSQYYTKTFCRNVDKETFPSILNEVYKSNEAFSRVNALKGLEATGLFPLDKSRINRESLRISTLFHNTETSTPAATSDNRITLRADTTITITLGNLISIQKELVKEASTKLESSIKSYFQKMNTN